MGRTSGPLLFIPRYPEITIMSVRHLLRNALAALAATLTGASALAAASFPTGPVRLVVWTAPGSSIDISARVVAEALSQQWDEPVIVENRVGASGVIATKHVADAKPDGHTLLVTTNSGHVLNPLVRADIPFDPERDFTPLGVFAEGQYAFVAAADAPYSNLKEFLEAARQSPKGLAFGSPGQGTAMHLFGDMLGKKGGAELIHVPYTNMEVGSLTDMMDGALGAAFWTNLSARTHSEAGRIKVLAVSGDARSRVLPDVPTFSEQGFENYFSIVPWIGLFLPDGVPPETVEAISAAVNAALDDPKVQRTVQDGGFDLRKDSPAAFKQRLQEERDRWQAIIQETGFSPT
ncbi:MAG: Bug family tripartite tricarboxylate transporter substrate binding protein [Pigmentiphaga sp.]